MCARLCKWCLPCESLWLFDKYFMFVWVNKLEFNFKYIPIHLTWLPQSLNQPIANDLQGQPQIVFYNWQNDWAKQKV